MSEIYGSFTFKVGKKKYPIKCTIAFGQFLESEWNRLRKQKQNLPCLILNAIAYGLSPKEVSFISCAIVQGYLKQSEKRLKIYTSEMDMLTQQIIQIGCICIGGEEFGKKAVTLYRNHQSLLIEQYHPPIRKNTTRSLGQDYSFLQ